MGMLEDLMNELKEVEGGRTKATIAEIQAHLPTWWKKPNPFSAGDVIAMERKMPNTNIQIGTLMVVVSLDPSDLRPQTIEHGLILNCNDYADMVVARAIPDEAGVGYLPDQFHSAFFRLATEEEIAANNASESQVKTLTE